MDNLKANKLVFSIIFGIASIAFFITSIFMIIRGLDYVFYNKSQQLAFQIIGICVFLLLALVLGLATFTCLSFIVKNNTIKPIGNGVVGVLTIGIVVSMILTFSLDPMAKEKEKLLNLTYACQRMRSANQGVEVRVDKVNEEGTKDYYIKWDDHHDYLVVAEVEKLASKLTTKRDTPAVLDRSTDSIHLRPQGLKDSYTVNIYSTGELSVWYYSKTPQGTNYSVSKTYYFPIEDFPPILDIAMQDSELIPLK